MIYWLSGSLVVLVLVTFLLKPESTQSTDVDAKKVVNSKKVITTGVTNNLAQSLNESSEKNQAGGGLKTTDFDTKNVGTLVDSKSVKDNIYRNQANKTSAVGTEKVRVLLIPDQETTVSRSGSSLAAARINKLNVTLGSTFSAGKTLITFNCNVPRARLAMSKAELSGAVETHTAKLRMQGLEQAGDVEVALAASVVAKARAEVKLGELQISYCSITAPWDGRVAKVYVRNHMTVTPGQPMLDLVKSGPLRLRVNIPSRLLSQLRIDSKFEVTIDETEKTYQAIIVAINSRVDAVSQTVEIEGLMTQRFPELLAGMSGTAIMPEM
ncbi:MAG: HlyD family efflux transporter periplasmic adaptor subunit [Nitrosomonadaceae bacterium]